MASFTWSGASGADWSVATDWNPVDGPPGAGDFALLPAASSVNSASSEAIGTLSLLAGAGLSLASGASFTVSAAIHDAGAVFEAGTLVVGAAIVTLDGTGALALSASGNAASIVAAATGDILVNVSQTISGGGSIGGGGLGLTNEAGGVIDALSFFANPATLTVGGTGTIANAGLLEATTGTLVLTSPVSGSGTIAAAGGHVTLASGVSAGGHYVTSGGGTIVSGASTTLDGTASPVVNAGLLQVGTGESLSLLGTFENTGTLTAGAQSTLTVAGTLDNTGTINLGATFVATGTVTLSGGGSLVPSGTLTGGTLVNVDNTIESLATGSLSFINAADGVLQLGGFSAGSHPLVNEGLIASSSGLSGTFDNAGGIITASTLVGATILGGSFGGSVSANLSGTLDGGLNPVTATGISVPYHTTLVAVGAIDDVGGMTLNGTLAVGGASATLTGGGTITMQATANIGALATTDLLVNLGNTIIATGGTLNGIGNAVANNPHDLTTMSFDNRSGLVEALNGWVFISVVSLSNSGTIGAQNGEVSVSAGTANYLDADHALLGNWFARDSGVISVQLASIGGVAGALTLDGAGSVLGYDSVTTRALKADFTVEAGGTLAVVNGASFDLVPTPGTTIVAGGVTQVTVPEMDYRFGNAGLLQLGGGTVSLDGVAENTGTVLGFGTLILGGTGLDNAGGTLAAQGGMLVLQGMLSGGAVSVAGGAVLELATGAGTGSAGITFVNGGGLRLDAGVTTAGTLADGLGAGFIWLAALPYHAGATAMIAGGTLVATSGGITLDVALGGVADGTLFDLTSDGGGGSLLSAFRASFTVHDESELNNLIESLVVGRLATPGSYTIELAAPTGTIALDTDLLAFNLAADVDITIAGNGETLDGGGSQRGLLVYAGNVTVDDLTITHATATGGAGGDGTKGGGGGAGLGGGLFVASGGTVTLNDVAFTADDAVGGAGGSGFGVTAQELGGGGGGGLGGDGGSGSVFVGGGGGIGQSATGGAAGVAVSGGRGIVPGTGPGGTITYSNNRIGYGGLDGGGGGMAGLNSNYRAAGGGIGGSYFFGGFGGGGGGSTGKHTAEAGGFGGGGGGGNGRYASAAGGFGGGNGVGGGVSGTSIGGTTGGGGGGLGAGGAIFVQQGGSVVLGNGSIGGGSVAGGAGGAGPERNDGFHGTGTNGSAAGAGIFLQGNETLSLAPALGETLSIADAISDETGAGFAGGSGAGTLLLAGAGTVQLQGANRFSGGIALGAGGTLELGHAAAGGSGAIRFDGAAVLRVDLGVAPMNTIVGLGSLDAFDAGGITLGVADFDADTHVLAIAGTGGTLALTLDSGTYDPSGFSAVPDAAGTGTLVTFDGATTNACYAAGTGIATPGGRVRVEDLRVGDRVLSAFGGEVAVQWVGYRQVDCRRHARPEEVWPVRVRARAFGVGLPARDLVLSPDHSVHVDGVLVPVRYLLNDATVTQECWDTVTYFHVELPAHDVILAEGLPCESYLDTGNRGAFANGGAAVMLHPDFALRVWEASACAPLVTSGAALHAVQARLQAVAESLGFVAVEDAGVALLAGGVPVGLRRVGNVWHAVLAGDATVRLRSRSFVPARMLPGHADHRRLGVAVASLRADGVAVGAEAFGAGWHEAEAGLRWTDGDGALCLPGVQQLSFVLRNVGAVYWHRNPQVTALTG